MLIFPWQNVLIYLIRFVFGLLAIMFGARWWLSHEARSSYNPAISSLHRITNYFCWPMLAKKWPRSYWFLLIFLTESVQVWLQMQLMSANWVSFLTCLVYGFWATWNELGIILFFSVLITALCSWFVFSYQPWLEMLQLIIDPIQNWLRSQLPVVGGLDFSPIVILFVLSLLNIFVQANLAHFYLLLVR